MIGDAPRIKVGPCRVPALAPAIAASIALHAALALAAHFALTSRTPPDQPRVAYSTGEPVRVDLRERTTRPSAAPDAPHLKAEAPEPMPSEDAPAQAAPPLAKAAPARSQIRAAPARSRAEPSRPASAPTPAMNAPAGRSARRPKLDLPSPAASAAASADRPAGLTRAARVVQRPQPRYPSRAVRLGYEGTAEVEVAVSATGEVESVALRASSGRRLLDEAALEAARRGVYEPARSNGRPVRARVVIPFTFTLRERD